MKSAPLLISALLAVCLLAALTPRGRAASETGFTPRPLLTRVELERGRALMVDETGVSPLRHHEGARSLTGPGHFELAPGSRATVRWPGQGSLRLVGPTSVAWERRPSDGELLLRFGALHSADLELRRGTARIDLPGAWRLEVEFGSVSLRALASGGARLTHHAGSPVRAAWIGGGGVSAPEWIGPGETLRLTGTRRPSVAWNATRQGAAWSRASWPWGRGGIPDQPDLGIPGAAPWAQGDWPWGPPAADVEPWERWDWPFGATADERPGTPAQLAPQGSETELEGSHQSSGRTEGEVASDPRPVPGGPGPEASSQGEYWPTPSLSSRAGPSNERNESATDRAGVDPARSESSELTASTPGDGDPASAEGTGASDEAAPVEPPTFDAASWRGLEREQLEARGAFVLQRSSEWILEPLEGGVLRATLVPDATQPAWCFGSLYDYRVFPGASLLIEEDGKVRSHDGWIRILQVTPGRETLARE